MINLGNALKFAAAVTTTAAVGEAGYIGGIALANDVETTGKVAKEFVSPTPILVKKKGLFGKKSVVKVNPVTGKMSPYKGSKSPVNKKAIVVK